MSFSEVAQLIAAIAFAVLVCLCAIPLFKLGKTIDALTDSVKQLSNSTKGMVDGMSETVERANGQLERVDSITRSASEIAQDASAVSTLLSSTIGRPLIKIAAFSYATRKVLRIQKKDKQ